MLPVDLWLNGKQEGMLMSTSKRFAAVLGMAVSGLAFWVVASS